jgi:hypothetical protein
MKEILSKYVGHVIAINYKDPTKTEDAQLVDVGNDYFTIIDIKTKLVYHFPFRVILGIVTSEHGISTGSFSQKQYPAAIHIDHLIVYSGGIGAGFLF